MSNAPLKFKHGVIGTITSSTTMAGSIKITENLAPMFLAEGRLDLFELPEAMILKPINTANVDEDSDTPKSKKPNQKSKSKNKKDETANTQ